MSMITQDNVTGNIFIDTGAVKFQMFAGHIFPVRAELTGGGKFPLHEFRDQVTLNGLVYHVNEDRYAQFEIVEEQADFVVIAATGRPLCMETLPFATEYDGLISRYVWKFFRNSGRIEVAASLKLEQAVPGAEVEALALSWRGTPWAEVAVDESRAVLTAAEGVTLTVEFPGLSFKTDCPGKWKSRLAAPVQAWKSDEFAYQAVFNFNKRS